MKQQGWRRSIKVAIDRTVGAVGLVGLSPLLALVAVSIRASMGTPVIFRQDRPGLHGRIFRVVKFRTMRDAVDSAGNSLPDAHRITPLGSFLRETSLDEIPQLWNVARGDLSLVGPRPLLVRYLPRYSPVQARRHEVLPGITGWAQVNGRNAVGWSDKLAMDVWYVDHWSLALDAKILAMTVWKVLRRDGVSQQGHATMPEFEGTAGSRAEG